MVSDIPTRSTLKQYKAAFVSLTILAIVSLLYISSSEDVVDSSRLLKKNGSVKSEKSVIKRSMMRNVLGEIIKKERPNIKERVVVKFPKKPDIKTLRTARTAGANVTRDHLIWLMSYPFGGAEETITLVEKATGKSMATNYGDEMFTADGTKHLKKYTPRKIQNWVTETHRGPFQNNAELTMAQGNVLVRTHCSGFCLYEPHIECTEKMYMTSMMADEAWQDTCSSGKNHGQKLGKRYGQSLVNDVVVVLRDPKEMVAARFEHFVAMYGTYTYDDAGFLEYCKQVDGEHESYQQYVDIREGGKTSSFFDNGATVPCYTELTRIGMWSGRAITASRTRRNSLVVLHSDLANPASRDDTASDILDFAGFEKSKPKVKFQFDSTAPLTFDEELSTLMQNFITASYPESTKMYFVDPVGLNWSRRRGPSTQLAVSGEGQTVWLVNKPRNSPSTYYRKTGTAGNWRKNDRFFDFVAIDASGLNFWAIQRVKKSRTEVFYNVWKKHEGVDTDYVLVYKGNIMTLSVDSQGNVWGIGSDRKCYYRPHQGTFSEIEAPKDLRTIVVSDNGLHVWATTITNEIYFKPGMDGDWIKVDGSMKDLSVTSDGGLTIGTDANKNAYYRKGIDGSWIQIVGKYNSLTISGNGRFIWATQSGKYSYFANSEKLMD